MDPSWKSCPYCERLQTADGGASQPQRSTRLDAPVSEPPGPQRTRLESAPSGGERRTRLEGEAPWQEPAPPPSSAPRPTRLEEPDAAASGRRTLLQEGLPPMPSSPGVPPPLPSEPSGSALPSGANGPVRRLLGVLAAPDLGPGGSVFPVRGGKNTIGASRSNDIIVAGDSEVSGEHAVILHRNGTFHLTDRLSTNGTWVNDQEVPANGTLPLRDRDRIRCGRTELLFLVVEPQEGLQGGLDAE